MTESRKYQPNDIPKVLSSAFTRSPHVLEAANGRVGNVNITDIASRLIYECGRWTERYASDFLIDWDHVRDIAEERIELPAQGLHELIIFGIRRCGVDGTSFLMSRVFEKGGRPDTHCYNRVLALDIRVNDEKDITLVLKDIQHYIQNED